MIEVICVPLLVENYAWLLHDHVSLTTVVVDPGHAGPILQEANSRGWTVSQVWNTHWHDDHVAGNGAIKAATEAIVVAPDAERHKISMTDEGVVDGSSFKLGHHDVHVIAVPGHTSGHIAFHLPDVPAVFVGDTLFAMGCGRLFEGTAEQMFSSLQRLGTLPPETLVYCGHEYTQLNTAFALAHAPRVPKLVRRAAQVALTRAKGLPTVPTTIEIESATNPFLRAGSADRFAELRRARDTYQPSAAFKAMQDIGASSGMLQ